MSHDLTRWLLTEGRQFHTMPALLQAFVPVLQQLVPVDRLWMGTSVLHPQAAAYAWCWSDNDVAVMQISHERFATLDTADTPMRRLRLGARFVRLQPGDLDLEVLQDVAALFEKGFTGFYALPLHLRGKWSGGFTWSTRDPGGFTQEHIDVLDEMAPALSAVVEPLSRDSMYTTLLCTYLGADAGRRVVAGQVRRGDGRMLRAAVLFCDVRGFTILSQQLSTDALLSLLGDVFEGVVDAVHGCGGQVLKFMGDGLLAVFIEDDVHDAESVCLAATAAAEAVQVRMASVAHARVHGGLPTAMLGVGLHYGDLTYGNIGAPTRLDFTVIGPSVNLAARVEGACGGLGEHILATAAVAERSSGWERVADVPMKGMAAPITVYRRSG